MNRMLARTTMIALGFALLVGLAIAQDAAKKEAPRSDSGSTEDASIKDDSGSEAKEFRRSRRFSAGKTQDSADRDDWDSPKQELPRSRRFSAAQKRAESGADESNPDGQDSAKRAPAGEDNSARPKGAFGGMRPTGKRPAGRGAGVDRQDIGGPADGLPRSPGGGFGGAFGQRLPGGNAWDTLPDLPGRGLMRGAPPGTMGPFPGQMRGVGGGIAPENRASGEGRLAQDAEQLARRISAAKTESEKDKLVIQLREILEKQFDVRQRRHESEVEELEAQVQKLRERIHKRQDNRSEIISQRLNVVIRDAEGLGW
jgi:hypothetical protein